MRIPQKSLRPWRRVIFTVKAAQFTPVLTNCRFAQSLTQTCSSLRKWTWIQCSLTTMMLLFKLKKLPRGCTLLHLKLNKLLLKKCLNQSLKKRKLEKNLYLPYFIVNVKILSDVTLCNFLYWFTTNNKQGYYFLLFYFLAIFFKRYLKCQWADSLRTLVSLSPLFVSGVVGPSLEGTITTNSVFLRNQHGEFGN